MTNRRRSKRKKFINYSSSKRITELNNWIHNQKRAIFWNQLLYNIVIVVYFLMILYISLSVLYSSQDFLGISKDVKVFLIASFFILAVFIYVQYYSKIFNILMHSIFKKFKLESDFQSAFLITIADELNNLSMHSCRKEKSLSILKKLKFNLSLSNSINISLSYSAKAYSNDIVADALSNKHQLFPKFFFNEVLEDYDKLYEHLNNFIDVYYTIIQNDLLMDKRSLHKQICFNIAFRFYKVKNIKEIILYLGSITQKYKHVEFITIPVKFKPDIINFFIVLIGIVFAMSLFTDISTSTKILLATLFGSLLTLLLSRIFKK